MLKTKEYVLCSLKHLGFKDICSMDDNACLLRSYRKISRLGETRLFGARLLVRRRRRRRAPQLASTTVVLRRQSSAERDPE